MTSYEEYVSDESFQQGYAEYQQRYASQVPERDKVTIGIVEELAGAAGRPLSVLDAGCSTGNLLLHLKNRVPGLELTGGDLVPAILEECRRDEALAGISFEELDVTRLPADARFDVVIANAVLYLFDDATYDAAFASVAGALRPGGSFVCFDFFHPWEQDLAIVERSETHPDGLALHFRPYGRARAAAAAAGLAEPEFRPFRIPVELPRPERAGEIVSYTRRAEDGELLLFRGTLFQPWCHLVARKP